MEQITVTSTLEKIQELIDNNAGDTGRLNHIIDFINNEKPLYNTDRVYLENKLNSKITITPKKVISEIEPIPEQIKKLIKIGKGDPGRLEHILDMLKKEKTLYQSDKQYLEKKFGIIIIEKLKKKLTSNKIKNKAKNTSELKENTKKVMPKNWIPNNEKLELDKISKKLKKEEEIIMKQNQDSNEISIQKVKLVELIRERESNDEKIIKERQLLEKEITNEKNLIQAQTEITENVNLQKRELSKVKNERESILKNIEAQKNIITKELVIQKKQLIQAQTDQEKIELQVVTEKTKLVKMAKEQKNRLIQQGKMAQEIKGKQKELEKTKKDYNQIISQVNEEKKEIKQSEMLKREIKLMEKDLNKSVKDRLKILKIILK